MCTRYAMDEERAKDDVGMGVGDGASEKMPKQGGGERGRRGVGDDDRGKR